MIKGARLWDQESRFDLDQTDNSIELTLGRYGATLSAVTCGPTAAINCLLAIDAAVDTETSGGWQPQAADVLALWFHDPRNWPALRAVREETDPESTVYSPHEVPQYYPPAVEAVFGARCDFLWLNKWSSIVSRIGSGMAIQLCLPGHYIAAVAYDDESDELIYHDSYPKGRSGFSRRLTRETYSRECQPFALVYEETP